MWRCVTHVRWVIRPGTRVGALRAAVSDPDDFVFFFFPWWVSLDGPGLVEGRVVTWGRSCERGGGNRAGRTVQCSWLVLGQYSAPHGAVGRVAGPRVLPVLIVCVTQRRAVERRCVGGGGSASLCRRRGLWVVCYHAWGRDSDSLR